MKSRRMSLVNKTQNQLKKRVMLSRSIKNSSLFKIKSKFPSPSLFTQRTMERQYAKADSNANETLENVLARTSIGKVDYEAKQSLSCMHFERYEQESKSDIFKKDQQQQLSCQNYKRPKSKFSVSYNQKGKRVDSLLLQFLQEGLEHYSGHFKKIVKKSYSRFCTYEEGQSISFQNQIIITSKLVLWTESKFCKILRQFYRYLPTYSIKYMQIKNKKNKTSQKNLLIQIMKAFLISKYKTQKLAQQNYLNLAYSLYSHLRRAREQYARLLKNKESILCKIRYFQIFDRILTLQYDYEDISFYQYMKWLLTQIVGIQNQMQNISYKIGEADLYRFLNRLTNNDIDLVNNYHRHFKKIFSRQMIIYQEQLLYYILNDFKTKKQQISSVRADVSFRGVSINEGFQRKEEKYKYDRSFWYNQVTSHNIQPQLYDCLKQQVYYQSKRLMDILSTNINDQQKLVVLNLIIIKVCRIMHATAEISKLKLFNQFNLQEAQKGIFNAEMITYLQEIQSFKKNFQSLKASFQLNILNGNQVSFFIKRMLVCRLFLDPLERLIQNFEDV